MELTINMNNPRGKALEQKVKLFQTAGFTAMDYSLCEMVRADSPFCQDGYRGEAADIRAITDRMGFPVVQTHAPFQFSAEYWEGSLFEEITFPRMVRSLEISAMLGAKISVVHPIHPIVYKGHEEELYERNMTYYKRLLPYCREYGVKVAVENMFQRDPRYKCITHDTCSRPEELIRYVDGLNSEYAVACLDIGHVGLPVQQEIEAADFVRKLGHDRLQSLHIHDNDYTNDQHLPPYFGKINWAEVSRALGEIDYQGDFIYEIKHDLILDKDEGFLPIAAGFLGSVGKHLTSMIDENRPK